MARRFWFDALIVVGIGISIAGAVLSQGKKDGPEGPMWLDIVLVLLIVGPLLARRRFPFGAPLGVGAGVVIASFADNRLVPFDIIAFLAGCSAVFLLAQRRDWRQAVSGLAMAVGVEAIVVRNDPRGQLGQFIFVSLIFTVVWVVGFTLGRKFAEADEAKERATRAEREREARARAAVADERARIARELHDVVGHSVSVMTVQASAVRRLLEPDQEKEREALLVVEQTGREALAEMRRMVGVLRSPDEAASLAPQPGLRDLEALVEHARKAGLPVDLHVDGDPVELPPGVDLAAYRVVQEGLTNALKHAHATRAEVRLHYDHGQVEVSVTNDGRRDGSASRGGHGLAGMRERIAVYGGRLEAGPQPAGRFRLRATLPAKPA